MTMLRGIDCSNYQGNPDFNQVKNQTQFVIVKVSEGTGYVNPTFTRTQTECRKVGLLLGYYHFARPDAGNNPGLEAGHFLNSVGSVKAGEIFCLDYEPATQKPSDVDWCKQFLDYVYQHTGCKGFIYLNQSQVKNFDWSPLIAAGYPLWLARYDNNPNDIGTTTPWPQVVLKQYNSSGQVSGIAGNVDMDSFFGDEAAFKSYGYQSTSGGTIPPMDPDKQRGINAFDNYRRERQQGPEGSYEGYANAVIGSDKDAPGKQKDLDSAKAELAPVKAQLIAANTSLEVKDEAIDSLKAQLQTTQEALDKLAQNPPTIGKIYKNPVALFFIKLADFAEH